MLSWLLFSDEYLVVCIEGAKFKGVRSLGNQGCSVDFCLNKFFHSHFENDSRRS